MHSRCRRPYGTWCKVVALSSAFSLPMVTDRAWEGYADQSFCGWRCGLGRDPRCRTSFIPSGDTPGRFAALVPFVTNLHRSSRQGVNPGPTQQPPRLGTCRQPDRRRAVLLAAPIIMRYATDS